MILLPAIAFCACLPITTAFIHVCGRLLVGTDGRSLIHPLALASFVLPINVVTLLLVEKAMNPIKGQLTKPPADGM